MAFHYLATAQPPTAVTVRALGPCCHARQTSI